MTARRRPPWRCPSCRRTFVTKNMSHSCRRMTVGGASPRPAARDRRALSVLSRPIRQLGPTKIDPQGRGIVFQVRARAIGLAKNRWIDLTLWLKSGASHPRVRKVDDYGPLGRVLHFRLTREEDLDRALARLLAEAYAVAAPREVKRTPAAFAGEVGTRLMTQPAA